MSATASGDNSAPLGAEDELVLAGNGVNAEESLPPGDDPNVKVPEASLARKRSSKEACIVADCYRKLNSQYERKCGKFHPLSDFDGLKKSCRASLERHNVRQKEARLRRYESVVALQLKGEAPSPMELRRRAVSDTEGCVLASAASLPLPLLHPQTPWEASLAAHRSMMPDMRTEASTLSVPLAPSATPSLPHPQPQAQSSDDATSTSPPFHPALSAFCLLTAPSSMEPPPIEADIADAFYAAVQAAADAAGGAPAEVSPTGARPMPASPGQRITGVGAVLTHAALLEPSIDAREAHELQALGLGQLNPAFMPPVLEIPL